MDGFLVSDLMSRQQLLVFKETDSLEMVVILIERAHIGGTVVLDEQNNLVGTLSKTDLVSEKTFNLVCEKSGLRNVTVKEVMRKELPVSVGYNQPLLVAVDKMMDNKVHRIFVKDEEDQLVGILTTYDLLKGYTQSVGQQNLESESQAEQKPVENEEQMIKLDEKIARLVAQKQREVMVGK